MQDGGLQDLVLIYILLNPSVGLWEEHIRPPLQRLRAQLVKDKTPLALVISPSAPKEVLPHKFSSDAVPAPWTEHQGHSRPSSQSFLGEVPD